MENIWSPGSLDRLIIGFCNQGIQRRDEFICNELTNHLFQSPNGNANGFGMDLAAINIQRGRDHGIPSFTAWREPCGLKPIKNWNDLKTITSSFLVNRLRAVYRHVDDVDLYSAGLAEKPVRGGIVGPTFACIIAQQFANLRKGDRFWYENGGFESSFTPAQLQQIRKLTYAHVLCQTTNDIDTIQPYVFLNADHTNNARIKCDDPLIDNFDVTPWIQKRLRDDDNEVQERVLVVTDDENEYAESDDDGDGNGDVDRNGDGDAYGDGDSDSDGNVNGDDDSDSDGNVDGAGNDDDYVNADIETDFESRKRPMKKRKRPKPTSKPIKRPNQTPTIYYVKKPHDALDAVKIKLQNVSTATIAVANKNRQQTTRRPLKIIPIKDYQNIYGHDLLYFRPTPLTPTTNKLNYMLGHVKKTTTVPKDYNLNININYLMQSSTPTNTPTYDRYEYVTKRPQPLTETVRPIRVTAQPVLISEFTANNYNHVSTTNKYLTLQIDKYSPNKDKHYVKYPTINYNPTEQTDRYYVSDTIKYHTITNSYNTYKTKTTKRPYSIRPNDDTDYYVRRTTKRPYLVDDDYVYVLPNKDKTTMKPFNYNDYVYDNKDSIQQIYSQIINSPALFSTTHRPDGKLDFPDQGEKNFVKISSVKGGVFNVKLRPEAKEGELILDEDDDYNDDKIDLLKIDVIPSEVT